VPPTVDTGYYGLNPGLIRATPFYNTTNDAQSKYYWGAHPFQYAPNFNPSFAQQGQGPQTPFGIQSVAKALSPQDMQAIMNGTYQAPATANATRIQQYNAAVANQPAMGSIAPIVMPTAQARADATMGYKSIEDAQAALEQGVITQAQYDAIVAALGG
jgi:hypothetical protein